MSQLAPVYGLHDYQQQVLDDILAAVSPVRHAVVQPERRVVAHLPTGAGKTRIACHAASTILNRYDSVGKAIIWLASTEELCQQASDDLAYAWRYLGNRPVNRYELWGNRNVNPREMKDGIMVAGLPKLWQVARNDYGLMQQLAQSAALVIFDEAHQAVAQTYRFLTEQLITYQAPLLGLTATPGRTALISYEDQDLAEMFDAQKISIDSRGHGNPVTYLTRQGFLADPEFIPIRIESEIDVQNPREDREYTGADLRRIGNDSEWRRAIMDATVQALRFHRRVIVFCPSVESVKRCVAELRQQGHQAADVLGTTPPETRREIIERYRSSDGQAMAIVNYGVLTAGFDAPRTSCVVIGRPTTSLVLYSQMVGRALRGPKSGGNRTCQIYTVADTSLPGFQSVATGFQNWEELWRQE